MTVHLQNYNLTYISIPKVACTSLKHYFYELENGQSFTPAQPGNQYATTIHRHAKSIPFSNLDPHKMMGHKVIAVVRDPWKRILSCYADKVVHRKALHDVEFSTKQAALGMVADPSLDNFIDLLAHYRAASPLIRHHSQPLSFFLGTNPTFYDRIFSLRQLPELIEYIGTIVPDAPQIKYLNRRTAKKVSPSQEQIKRNRPYLEAAFREDIDLYGAFF